MEICKLPVLFSSLVLALCNSIGTAAPITTLVIDLGAGTAIEGGTFDYHGTNLPLPALPAGSILRSIEADIVFEATDNNNWASDLSVLFDPTPESPGGDFSLDITDSLSASPFGATVGLNWPTASNSSTLGTRLLDTKTAASWWPLVIDLSTTGLFLGNSYQQPGWMSPQGGTWSGTITLTYDNVSIGTDYATWSGGAAADADTNGDGVLNAVAYALGAVDVSADATALLPTSADDGTYLVFTYNRSDDANDDGTTAIEVEYGSDLSGWTVAVDAVDGVIITETPGSPTDAVEVKIPKTLAVGDKLFARLRVVVTP